jgi:hypothetical protein
MHRKRFPGCCPVLAWLAAFAPAFAGEVDDPDPGPLPIPETGLLRLEAETAGDWVSFRDGSIIRGEIVGMHENSLKVKPRAGKETEASWVWVKTIRSSAPLRLVLRSGRRIEGPVRPGEMPGSIWIDPPGGESEVLPTRMVVDINPPPDKLAVKGSVNLGASITDGNTRNRTVDLLWNLEAKDRRNRLGTTGVVQYADDEGGVTARNARGDLQYDRFIWERVYGYAGGLLQSDSFQDLDLRTVLSAGAGFQPMRPGDYPEEYLNGARWLNGMDLRGEGGLSYFVEDFGESKDRSFPALRWAIKWDWPIFPRLSFFHRDQGYPNIDDWKDVIVYMDQGVRCQVAGGLQLTFQVNWTWDNHPSPGFDRNQFIYIVAIGWNFDTHE